jgi:hypothetical protein
MTLFVDIYITLLCHMSPVNITIETYMRVLQKMFKIGNYLWTCMWVLQWMFKKSTIITRLICMYYNGCKKTNNYLQDLYVVIAYLK